MTVVGFYVGVGDGSRFLSMLVKARMSVDGSRHLCRSKSESRSDRFPCWMPGLLGRELSAYLWEWVRVGGSKRRAMGTGRWAGGRE